MKRDIFTAALVLALAPFLAGCASGNTAEASVGDPWGVVEVPRGENVRLLVATALDESVVGPEGLEQMRGAELAADNWRYQGFRAELVVEDSGCDAGRAAGVAIRRTMDRNLVAVIGNTCSSACAAAVPSYEPAHVPMVSPGCSSGTLVDQVLHSDSFVRTVYDDALEGELAARFAYVELGARRAAILHDGTPETTGSAEAFAAAFVSLGGQIVDEQGIERGARSFRTLLSAVHAHEPDVLYAPLLLPDGARLVLQASATSLADVRIIGGRHLQSAWFVQEAGRASDGVYAVAPHTTSSAYSEVAAEYERRYRQPPGSAAFAYGYDAASLILAAIADSSTVTPGGDLLIGRQALHDTLYRTAAHEGLTGKLTCSQWGDCSAAGLAMYRVQEGQWQPVYLP